MEREHPNKFKSIRQKISSKIPGVEKISPEKSPDGRLLLQFNDKGFQDPFYRRQIGLTIFLPSWRWIIIYRQVSVIFEINFDN